MPEEERLTLVIKVCTLGDLRIPVPPASLFSAIVKHPLANMAVLLSFHYWWHLDSYMPGVL